jgi:type IV pilus assembly protein PilV
MKRTSSGFSLIEVLVSIVILSIALLGTAGLMSASLRNTNTAFYRSQATVMADDILERMRANITAARNQQYDIALDGTISGSATDVARFDAEEWLATLASVLPGGRGSVDVDPNGVAEIMVLWGDDDEPEMFRTTSRL